ncbi:MAG: biotin/lipoyl-binding protein [Synechococcaceae cyanobacterium RM1_1_27]|nr:biotin/lipoyl-binding protein [Synechococcaceae cyanobacterium RM1_1_27]
MSQTQATSGFQSSQAVGLQNTAAPPASMLSRTQVQTGIHNRYQQLPQVLGSKIAAELIANGMIGQIDQVVAARVADHYQQRPRVEVIHKNRSGVWLFWIALWFALPAGMLVGSGWRPWALAADPIQPKSKSSPSPIPSPPAVRPLKITVTLSQPDDLLVKQGQYVKEGQILASRIRERQRLELQKSGLQANIKQLSLSAGVPLPPAPPREIPTLPEVTFASEAAKIDQAQAELDRAVSAVNLQERKLDSLASLDPGSLPAAVAEREQLELSKLREAMETAKVNLRLAQANLSQAQELRGQQEYNHNLLINNQEQDYQRSRAAYEKSLSDLRNSEQQRQVSLANLQEKLAAIETQLATLSTVRSPYNGTVRRIKFTGQTNNELSAELVLVAASSSSDTHTPAASPSVQNSAKADGGASSP